VSGIRTIAARLDIPYDENRGLADSLQAPRGYKESAKVAATDLLAEAYVMHNLLLSLVWFGLKGAAGVNWDLRS
jgi:hypothetical protein